MARFSGIALATVLAVLPARSAHAGACCGEVSAFGDRLTSAEIAAGSVGFSVRPRFGSFDRESRFHSIFAGGTDITMEVDADTVVRVLDRLELGASASGVVNVRASGDLSAVGGGVGDARARARAILVRSADTRYWPGVSTVLGVVIPTGVPASRTTEDLAVDVTGQGSGEVVLGLSLEKLWEEVFFARVDGAVGFFAPESVGASEVARSPRLTIAAAAGPSFSWGSIGAGVIHEAEGAPVFERGGIPASARTRTELALFGWIPFNRTLALLASVRGPLPVDGMGTQETADVSASIALRIAALDPTP